MNNVRTGLLIIGTAVLALGLSLPASAIKDALGFVRIRPADIQWRDEPGYDGLKMAVLEGDPSKSGLYVIRVKFPPGLMTRPHRHPHLKWRNARENRLRPPSTRTRSGIAPPSAPLSAAAGTRRIAT